MDLVRLCFGFLHEHAAPLLTEKTLTVTTQFLSREELEPEHLALREKLDELAEIIAKKSSVIQSQHVRINILKEQLRLKLKEKFAASSEVNPLQSRLFNDAAQAAKPPTRPTRKAPKKIRIASRKPPRLDPSGKDYPSNSNYPELKQTAEAMGYTISFVEVFRQVWLEHHALN